MMHSPIELRLHSSAIRRNKHHQDAFHYLVQELSTVLGTSSGIDSADVDPKQLCQLMKAYGSDREDWVRYAFSDTSRSYTRNLVNKGNGKSNMVSWLYSSLCPLLVLLTSILVVDTGMDAW